MARENTVYLYGQICGSPRIFVNPNSGEATQATFVVKIMRRPFLNGEGQHNMGKLRVDFPPVVTRDKELISKIGKLADGDMVDIKGVLTTKEVNKKCICPEGHMNVSPGTSVYITPIYICQREQKLSEAQGDNLLRERCEVSNNVMIIGTLCRDPAFYEYSDVGGNCMTQYQIASNRRYHIRDGHEETRTDYPWVKTINKQGRDDYEHLKMGSTVYINGAIQTRPVEREHICQVCGVKFKKEETVTELFPYSVEYLQNCVFDNPEEEEKE